MRRAGLLLTVLFLAGHLACKEKKKPDGSPAGGAHPAAPAAAGTEPDLPDPLALDCARIVPGPVRAAHFSGFTVEPVVEEAIATCLLTDGTVRASVSLFCHRRKRNWNFADELARDGRKKRVDGVGRAAYARNDHIFFYPSKLDCLARVIWPGDPKKGADIARALDGHLAKATVSAPPAP